jgi:hypothetical protein
MTNPIQRLREAIEGERRDWHVVEVRPDDIAAMLDIAEAARSVVAEQDCILPMTYQEQETLQMALDALRAALDRLEEVGS